MDEHSGLQLIKTEDIPLPANPKHLYNICTKLNYVGRRYANVLCLLGYTTLNQDIGEVYMCATTRADKGLFTASNIHCTTHPFFLNAPAHEVRGRFENNNNHGTMHSTRHMVIQMHLQQTSQPLTVFDKCWVGPSEL